MATKLRVGVDIGGTFTDIVVQNPELGTTLVHKVLSTPHDPSVGMLQGLDDLGVTTEMDFLVHGTTAGLNALLSRAGERLALVTTEGFHDVPFLGRGGNPDIWSLHPKRPEPLVAADDILTVSERVRFDGSVERVLSEADAQRVVNWLAEKDITSVAVVFLHAHQNPVNEIALRDLLSRLAPHVSVVLSHEVAPEQGEFERASTTLATAYVARTVDRYLTNLHHELSVRQCTAPLQVMRSSGGICSASLVTRQPIQTILSGPAGGVVAVETLARRLNRPNLIAIDMGGTSSDVSLVIDGKMTLATEADIAGQVLRMPVVELHTIGAGGGSVASVEAGGLRVGPRSAGSTPGPACYGLGGTEPTVTDAQLHLGRINAEEFLGGRMKLDAEAARLAIASVGDELGMTTADAAEGILAVANGLMANAIRTLAMRRGVDPREFSLVAFGGAGPLHGAALADELGIAEVIVPFATGVLSAWGMLHAEVRHDVSTPLSGRADDPAAQQRFRTAKDQLRLEGDRLLDAEHVPVERRVSDFSADMRYVGQEHAITVPTPEGSDVVTAFHDAYHDRFGHAMPASAVEFVNVRLAAVGQVGTPIASPASTSPSTPLDVRRREVHINGHMHSAVVIDRDELDETPAAGPAIIQEGGSTTLVPPTWQAFRGDADAMILRKVGR